MARLIGKTLLIAFVVLTLCHVGGILFMSSFPPIVDYGYRYAPRGWHSVGESVWERKYFGVRLRHRGIQDFVGTTWMYPTFDVVASKRPVELLGATLVSADGSVRECDQVFQRDVRTPCDEFTMLVPKWDFHGSHMPTAVGRNVKLILKVRIGNARRRIPVNLDEAD